MFDAMTVGDRIPFVLSDSTWSDLPASGASINDCLHV